ncbi:hypothetical protein GCM10027605_71740 [Micromonospora zhanjiangensis]
MPRRAIPPEEIPDDAELTQYGKGQPGSPGRFRDCPRIENNEPDMSLLLGRLGVKEAAKLVFKWQHPLSAVRYTTAGTLRARGFVVRHTPSPSIPQHTSVLAPTLGGEPIEWDEDLAKIFAECFTEPDRGGGTRE